MNIQDLLVILEGGAAAAAVAVEDEEASQKKQKIDHRTKPRAPRRTYRHQVALMLIRRDYLGNNNLVGDLTTPSLGSQFHKMFRLSRGRFQVLMEDVMSRSSTSAALHFFKQSPSDGESRASLEARLLLPLKTLAFGVASHTFTDYFQMSFT